MSALIVKHKQRKDDFATVGIWWDDFKLIVRAACIRFSSRKRKEANRERHSLTKRLISAKNAFARGNTSKASEIRDLESSLSSLATREVVGAKIRSRAKWVEEGEKTTRYFFRLEQKRAEKNSFASLIDSRVNEASSQANMESFLTEFCRNLYAKDALDIPVQSDLIGDLEMFLSDAERDSCEGEFTKLWGAFRSKNRLALMGSPPSFISLSGMIWVMFLWMF